MTRITDTFKKRSMARLVFLSSGISEICAAWERFGPNSTQYPLMKPHRLRRVLNSDNPTVSDCELVSLMLGVELADLMFSGSLSSIESMGTPGHLIGWRESGADGIDGPVDRICFECDYRWAAKRQDVTEGCPTPSCSGTGQPIDPQCNPMETPCE